MARAVMIADFEAVKKSVYASGNTQFKHVDNDVLGHPIIMCDIKPEDDVILGLVWLKHELEA